MPGGRSRPAFLSNFVNDTRFLMIPDRKKGFKGFGIFRKKENPPLTKIIIVIIITIVNMETTRKHSIKRDAILKLLRSTTTHPGAQWVYSRLKPRIPGLSLATVYRNLNIFRQEGLALSLGVVNGEERFDGMVETHPHLICSRCGAVLDLPPEEAETLLQNCGKTLGGLPFSVDLRRTVFYGLCEGCAAEASGKPDLFGKPEASGKPPKAVCNRKTAAAPPDHA
jgi:Fur family peroxide stress response transcriptional regulator